VKSTNLKGEEHDDIHAGSMLNCRRETHDDVDPVDVQALSQTNITLIITAVHTSGSFKLARMPEIARSGIL
jgi:hypothetical protein